MSNTNRVVWSEGLFLRPEHFQQQDRFFEAYCQRRAADLCAYSWGLSDFEIEQDKLGIGKFSVRLARGVCPDGTPFSIPEQDLAPTPLDFGATARELTIYLALPLRTVGRIEHSYPHKPEALARYDVREVQVSDVVLQKDAPVEMQVAPLRLRLLTSADTSGDYACIPIARLIERRADGSLLLDKQFIPSALTLRATTRLTSMANELLGMVRQRADALAAVVSGSGRSGVGEIQDFLMLITLNRYEPMLAHVLSHQAMHPQAFFEMCSAMAGELTSFSSERRRMVPLPTYRHEDPRPAFDAAFVVIKKVLGEIIESAAVPLPLEKKQWGLQAALINDRSLIDTATFYLAVRADVPDDELQQGVPASIKVASDTTIVDIVRRAMPGIVIRPLGAAPRQLPYHAGYLYFQLERKHAFWDDMRASGVFALHVGVQWPEIDIQLWAVRSSR